jgi:hypothetical protein
MRALNCRDMESAGVASLSWDGRHLIRHASASWHRLGYWAGALLLTAMVFIGIAYWQQSADSDNDDEEIAILTDDLPIQYFLE